MAEIESITYVQPEPVGGHPADALVAVKYVGSSKTHWRPANSDILGNEIQAFIADGNEIQAFVEPSGAAAARIAAARSSVVVFADGLADQITGPVPEAEKLAWIKKEEAARSHIAGTATTAQTALLQGELNLTSSIDTDLDGLAAKIVAKADFYSVAVAAISGVRRATMASIDALGDTPTQAQIDAVLSVARNQAEAQFAALMQSAP